MKILTQEILKRLPPLYATEDVPEQDKIVQLKLFGGSGCTWYVVEYSPEERLFYCFANLGDIHNAEWGYTSLDELLALRFPPFKLPIERDMYFKPCKFKEVAARELKGMLT